ncbi:hypothetical protein [Flavonifractor porci]|uniref:hypothetical protein n=1 Tax=Flavonifractor porci TaxID=3133422 RepID=UPI00309A53C2
MNVNLETILLENEELKYLSEYTPYAEGGILSEFEEEGKRVAKALAQVNTQVADKRAKRLLLLRGFYFLGVLRGAEAYRTVVLDEVKPEHPDADPLPFELDEVCAQLFADGLNQLSRGDLYRLCAALGV